MRSGVPLPPLQEPFEARSRDRLVTGVPPDGIAARRLLDEKLVFRGPAGVLAGLGRQGAGGDDRSLVPADCVLVQGGRAEVAPLGWTSRSPSEIGAAGGGFPASLCLAGTQSMISIRPALTPALGNCDSPPGVACGDDDLPTWWGGVLRDATPAAAGPPALLAAHLVHQ